jgi:hypothetical protein
MTLRGNLKWFMYFQYVSVREIISYYSLNGCSTCLWNVCERYVSGAAHEEYLVFTPLCQHAQQLRVGEVQLFAGTSIVASKFITVDELSQCQDDTGGEDLSNH